MGVSSLPWVPPGSTTTASGARSTDGDTRFLKAGKPASVASSTVITWKDWKLPFGKRASAVPNASGTAENTPSMLRTRKSAESGKFVVCSADSTAGSMTHTSAKGFSAMRANPRVMKPQKYDAANVTRNEVNVIPKSSPAYLVRSPTSIFKAMRSISGFPPRLRWPNGLASVIAFAGWDLTVMFLPVRGGDFDENIHLLTHING